MNVVTRIRDITAGLLKSPWRIVPAMVSGLVLSVLVSTPAYAGPLDGGPQSAAWATLVTIILAVPLTLAFAGFTLIWHGLFPRKVEWTGEIARRMPWGSLFFGLVACIFILLIVAWLGSTGDAGGLLAVILLSAFVIMFVTFGKAAVIEWAGEMIDPAASGLRRGILGAGGLYLMLLIPVGGWLILAGIGFIAVGAAIMSYIPPKSPVSINPVVEEIALKEGVAGGE